MISDDLYTEINKRYPERDIEIDVSEDGETEAHCPYLSRIMWLLFALLGGTGR